MPPPFKGKPSLAEAKERLSRAGEHLDELKRAIEPIKFKLTHQQSQKFDTGHMEVMIFSPPEVPPRIGTIIGDVCYNLRAALDYLVFNLSAHDSGLDYQGTQFPIENRPKDFRYRVEARGLLGGMNPSHRALIEGLQPYKGCDWAKTLKMVSNPDKHRNLTPVQAGTEPPRMSGPATDLVEAGSPEVSAKIFAGTKMQADVTVATKITFADGLPVVQTLEEIQTQIASTLDAFQPEFE